ncbi:sensor histidine kinase [Blastomonas fulva]|uniref:histidine kinase n=1 Tax=Blastomonas fulva TaxID=1550728 RepID=A0ABM6MAY7_9SPHN|nr:HAMP domain-containing sensor histidine kinase [Blastomonas fulva]ASR53228.1 hypothetical protein B5J99_18655 [Blastomonas fulva]
MRAILIGISHFEPGSPSLEKGEVRNYFIHLVSYCLFLIRSLTHDKLKYFICNITYFIFLSGRSASLIALMFLITSDARANCWTGGDSEVRRMQLLVESNPAAALPKIASALARARKQGDSEKVGWLLSTQTAAYVALSLDDKGKKSAEEALAIKGLSLPLRADLYYVSLVFIYTSPRPEIEKRINELNVLKSQVPKESASGLCATITIATLHRALADFEKAIRMSGYVYRAAKRSDLDDIAALATLTMAINLLMAGDVDEADALAKEAEVWAKKKGYIVRFWLATYVRAQIALKPKPAVAAIKFTNYAAGARKLGMSTTAAEGGACRALVASNQMTKAARYCLTARQNADRTDVLATFLLEESLGEIDLALGKPAEALKRFNGLLAEPLAPVFKARADRVLALRAKAKAQLGNYDSAYEDATAAMKISTERNEAMQEREIARLRARFSWDRQRIANAELERDLARAEARDKVRNTWLISGGAGALGVSAMLLWIIYSGRRHRHQLEGLAVEARELARTKADLLATMSHEIRAPLGSLVLASARLAQSAGIPNDSRQKAEYLGAAADRLINQLDDLLLFSRIDSRQLPVSSDWFHIAAVVANAIKLAEPKVDAAGMAIRSTFGLGAPEKVYGDANRTAQLLTNLIENAAKHSGGKLIEVKIEGAPDGQYAMTVSDDGVGIAEDALPLMMRSFAQVDGSMSSAEGFGLGLAICKGLAELMGGSIALDSPPGSGLHVKICMPAEVTCSKAA